MNFKIQYYKLNKLDKSKNTPILDYKNILKSEKKLILYRTM